MNVAGVTITRGPADWQVLQQDVAGRADIALEGTWRGTTGEARVEARLVHEHDGAPVREHLDWQPAAIEGDRWGLALAGVPAGGLYRVETRVARRGSGDLRPLRGDTVCCLGVGDLWVIAGQSNASGTGLGAADDPPELGIHLLGNDERWKLATHPLEDATATRHPVTVTTIFHGHSPWLAFARGIRRATGLPIGLLPTALGGSPIVRWDPAREGDLYANLRAMVGLSGGRVRGVVWYQGESDCSPAGCDAYAARFRDLVATLRRDLGDPDLPVLTAQLSRVGGVRDEAAHRCWSRMREIQRQLAAEIPGVALVPTLDLPRSDEIHISAPGNVLLGRRFAAAALRAVYGREVPAQGLTLLEPPRLNADGAIRLGFSRPSGGWVVTGSVEEFVLECEGERVPCRVAALEEDGTVLLRPERAPGGPAVLHYGWGCDPEPRLFDRSGRPVVAFCVGVGVGSVV